MKELYETLSKQFYEAEEAVILAKIELDTAESQVGRHQRPAITQFPTDKEVAQWEQEHARLIARAERARQNASDAQANREAIRMKALQAHQELNGFERAVLRLTERLEN